MSLVVWIVWSNVFAAVHKRTLCKENLFAVTSLPCVQWKPVRYIPILLTDAKCGSLAKEFGTTKDTLEANRACVDFCLTSGSSSDQIVLPSRTNGECRNADIETNLNI